MDPVRGHASLLPPQAAAGAGGASRQPGADEDGRAAALGGGPGRGPDGAGPAGNPLELHPRAHRRGRRRASRVAGGAALSWTVLAPPGGRRVLIRWFDLDFGGDPPRKVLSAEEIARARRFHREADARRYLAGRAAMRRALGELLGSEPARLVFETGPHGKPGLAGAPCSFNFSRSGARAVLAVVEEGRVGVDLEAADAAPDSEDLAPLA